MKILVVGSLHEKDSKGDPIPYDTPYANVKAQFDAACTALGSALAGRGHTVVVGVPYWPMLKAGETAANYVIPGASAEPVRNNQPHTVVFYGPEEPEPFDDTPEVVSDSREDFKKLPNIRLIDKFSGRGPSKAKTIPNVADVDAVILLGGTEGTATIGYAAYSMKKPVIAVTGLKGAALEIYDDVLASDYRRYVGDDLTEGDLRALSVNWGLADNAKENREKAEEIVKVTEKLVKGYDAASKQGLSTLRFTIGGLVLLLVAWLAFYLRPEVFGTTLTFFLLLYVAAGLGAGLRILGAYKDNQITRLTWQWLSVELVIALIVAFGLALLYLIGSISFTGEVVVLNTTATDNTFSTIAVSMTLLGLAAGYLVPVEQLRQRLEKIVAQG
jgi:hypothetical protein